MSECLTYITAKREIKSAILSVILVIKTHALSVAPFDKDNTPLDLNNF